jgi:PAS domain S-box-containing protein
MRFRLALSVKVVVMRVILVRASRYVSRTKLGPRQAIAQPSGSIKNRNRWPPLGPARQHFQNRWLNFRTLRVLLRQKQSVAALLAIVFCCLLLQLSVTAQDKQTRRVLIVYEAGPSYPVVDLINEGIKTTLGNSRYRIEFYREYMETPLFSSPSDQQLIRDYYIHKYQSHMPDLIITVGPSPLQLMIETHKTYFPGVPVIFCLPARQRGSFIVDSDFTGVEADTSPAATLEAALRLLPGTKHLFVVAGTSTFDRQLRGTISEQLRPYEKRLDISYLTDLAMADFLERLKRLPEQAIILFASLGKDGAGTPFTASESGPLIVAAANAPIFTLSDRILNHGEVGGKVASAREQGKIAGSMALRILNGEKPQDIPKIESAAVYMFDWRALKRWGLDERKLPPGSIVINRQLTTWESYKWYMISGIAVFLAETLLILGLMWQRSRRHRAEAAVRESEGRFRLVANTAPVHIWMAGTDKLCTYVNKPWLDFRGRDLAAELGNGWTEGIHPEDIKASLERYTSSFDRREPFNMQYRVQRHDGEYRWVFDIGVPRFNSDNSFAGYIGSCIDVTERKMAEDALATLSGQLIEAQEEERKRIARELHDDYNQRLAMLAIDLEKTAQNVAEFSVEAAEQLYGFFDRVSELGGDLHSLSHSLHSSTLESLGLVAGVKAFCREFSEQQGLQVDFAHKNVPRGIPGDAALCMFRITQEALRNIKKHSGAAKAEVRLEFAGERLHLSVSDQGRGFDPSTPPAEAGIGLRSMEERLRVLGGHLELHSSPSKGATIDAWVPVKVARQRAS